MRVAYIKEERCDQSPFCPAGQSCPTGAISFTMGGGVIPSYGGGKLSVDEDLCLGCGKCVDFCPHSAVDLIAVEDGLLPGGGRFGNNPGNAGTGRPGTDRRESPPSTNGAGAEKGFKTAAANQNIVRTNNRQNNQFVGPVDLNDTNFHREVVLYDGVVLVDFWAEWCGPCRMMGPIVEQLARQYAGTVKVGKLNVDENPHSAETYGIMSIPTMLIFKDGEVVDRIVGAQPREAVARRLDSWLAR